MSSSSSSPDRIVPFGDLRSYGITFSRMHLGRLERAGKFPLRVQISERRIGWRVGELETFLANLSRGVTSRVSSEVEA